jgi:stalled ribosome alternative rescue factor ArfA
MVHNPVAKELRTIKFRSKVVKAKKGRNSYNRKKVIKYELGYNSRIDF